MSSSAIKKIKCRSTDEDYLLGVLGCGNASAIKRVIKRGTNPNFLGNYGTTPLDLAVMKGLLDCTLMLLECGADPNRRCRKPPVVGDVPRGEQLLEWTPLMTAATLNKPDCISMLLDYKADIDYRDVNEMSALACAVQENNPTCMEVLLSRGAEPGFPEEIAVSLMGNNKFFEILMASRNTGLKKKQRVKQTAIHKAVINNNNEELRRLLEMDSTEINSRDSNGNTALHLAVRDGFDLCVQTLLSKKASLRLKNSIGFTPLHIAAQWVFPDILMALLKTGGKPDIKGINEVTPLHIAARCGQEEQVRILLDHGADVSEEDTEKLTPLHYAVTGLDKGCIQLLIKRGAEVFAASERGDTPLDFAAMEGVEYFDMMVPSDVRRKGKEGVTALHVAAARLTERVATLVDQGADVNFVRSDHALRGFTPLHMAAKYGNHKAIKILLERDASVNARDEVGRTPLHYSALYGCPESIKLLLDKGATVNAKSRVGETPLHVAADGMTSAECISLLIKHGCQIEARDKKGHTPLYLSVLVKNIECMNVLLDNGANVFAEHKHLVTPLEASTMVSIEVFKTILDKLPKNSKDRSGLTALHCAAAHNSECLKVALEQGGNVNVRNKDGATPLHLAAEQGIGECVKLLLKHGADVNATDMVRLTPLHRAASDGHADCLKILLQKGAFVNAPALFQWTPLQLAAEEGHLKCIQVLVENGANINACDDSDNTVLMAAAKKAYFDCVKYLLEHDARLWKS